MTAAATLPLPEAIVGRGFYKLGYVTTSRERAIEHFTTILGFEGFAPFEPEFEAHLADGRVGQARLRCAFSKGRDIVVELMEPVDGLVELWSRGLSAESGFQVHFHHVGLVTEDLELVTAAFAVRGIEPALHHQGERTSFAYFPLPGVGHHVEHIQYFGDAGTFLQSVRSPL